MHVLEHATQIALRGHPEIAQILCVPRIAEVRDVETLFNEITLELETRDDMNAVSDLVGL